MDMNFLAHLFLSGSNKAIRFGNFIGDHVKGKQILNFPDEIRRGIELHRFIDDYTDHHPIVEQSKKRLRTDFHKYAPVVVDVYYDHFLATNWNKYTNIPLEKYSQEFYKDVLSYDKWMPERTRYMFAYMKKQDWLYSYRLIEGIDKVFKGMAKRTPFHSGMENAASSLELHYEKFQAEFVSFFPDIQNECELRLKDVN